MCQELPFLLGSLRKGNRIWWKSTVHSLHWVITSYRAVEDNRWPWQRSEVGTPCMNPPCIINKQGTHWITALSFVNSSRKWNTFCMLRTAVEFFSIWTEVFKERVKIKETKEENWRERLPDTEESLLEVCIHAVIILLQELPASFQQCPEYSGKLKIHIVLPTLCSEFKFTFFFLFIMNIYVSFSNKISHTLYIAKRVRKNM